MTQQKCITPQHKAMSKKLDLSKPRSIKKPSIDFNKPFEIKIWDIYKQTYQFISASVVYRNKTRVLVIYKNPYDHEDTSKWYILKDPLLHDRVRNISLKTKVWIALLQYTDKSVPNPYYSTCFTEKARHDKFVSEIKNDKDYYIYLRTIVVEFEDE